MLIKRTLLFQKARCLVSFIFVAFCLVVFNLRAQELTAQQAKQILPYADLAYKVYVDASFSTWEMIEEDPLGNGFYARAYKHIRTGEVVIVFEGTTSWEDWINNALSLVADKRSIASIIIQDQFDSSLDFAHLIQKEYQVSHITGHSLGGALAQFTASHINVPATVFNSLGLSLTGVATRKGPYLPSITLVVSNGIATLNEQKDVEAEDLVFRLVPQRGDKITVPLTLGEYSVEDNMLLKITDTMSVIKWNDIRKNSKAMARFLLDVHNIQNLRNTIANYANSDTHSLDKGMDVIVMIDSSSSMQKTDPKDLRVQALESLVNAAPDSANIGIVEFDSDSRVLSTPVRVGKWGSSNRQKLLNAAKRIDSNGGTDIVSAITLAMNQLVSSNSQFLLLSDGRDNKLNSTSIKDHIPTHVPIHTIALSNQADQSTLSRLAAHTGGNYEYAANAEQLSRVIHNLFGQATDQQDLLVINDLISQGQIQNYTVSLESGLKSVYFSNSWGGSDIDLSVTSPSGRRYTIDDAAKGKFGIEEKTYDMIRIENPESGLWQIQLVGVELPQPEIATTRVFTHESLQVLKISDNVTVPEEGGRYEIMVDDSDRIDWQKVAGYIIRPDGTKKQIDETPSYQSQLFANEQQPSLWSFSPSQQGNYQIQLTFMGQNKLGEQIQRSIRKTLQVNAPGNSVKKRSEIQPFIPRNR
ncbi:VWA domain-containing protein [Alteromonas hispanica]|uniref:VWA domain-containing protein n=1 Tax=Alteromonas hispanica TaxID=315421 RepID=A0A6L9MSK3_9ALTE|nr:VWA domain-containing protein [Alteromonas hispanica]NDW21194.1 VWA domain-containing protein [Alteromonas hispanica]